MRLNEYEMPSDNLSQNYMAWRLRTIGEAKVAKFFRQCVTDDETKMAMAYPESPIERLVYALALEWYFQKDVRADWSELEIEDRKDLWFKHVLRRLGIRHG